MRKSIAILSLVAVFAVLIGVDYSYANSPLAVTVQDDFNDGFLSPMWSIVTQIGSASWNESGGTLNVGGSTGQYDELVMRYNQPIADVGSARIDYDWTAYSDHKARVGLGLFDHDFLHLDDPLNKNGVYLKGVRYTADGLHAVDGGLLSGDYFINYDVPTTGALMIERNGTDFRASYLDGATWHLLFDDQFDAAGMPLYPFLFTSNSNTYPSWEVALDNFTAVVVPEPSSVILGGSGIVALMLVLRAKASVK